MDSDAASTWLTNQDNQEKFCTKIGPNVQFRMRAHQLIVFNVPLGITPEDPKNRQEVCEANNLEPGMVTMMRWVKPVNRRSQEQRTAHLIVTYNSADTANRAITNGIYICTSSYHSVSHRLGKCLHRRLFPAQKIYETDAVGK